MSEVTADQGTEAPPLTVQEAATLLRVCGETVRRYIKAGVLTASQPGRRYLVDRASLTRLMESVRR